MKQKRAIAIHDISCTGRCSLTVALPILSAAGIETSVIPTAVLSTHTGEFSGYTYTDLTDDMPLIARHWASLGLTADAIYTGFLGSYRQIRIVCDIIDIFKGPDTLVFVDPAMADNGRLYKTIDKNFPDGIKTLIRKADIIVPNMTEAMFLLGMPYAEGPYDPAQIDEILLSLSGLGPNRVILTGVYYDEKKLGAASYDASTKKIGYSFSEKVDGFYYGTGDVFASALLGAMMNGIQADEAISIAVHYTAHSIERTKDEGRDVRYGVNFEQGLGEYIKAIENERTRH